MKDLLNRIGFWLFMGFVLAVTVILFLNILGR
jgi:hypothetical protein